MEGYQVPGRVMPEASRCAAVGDRGQLEKLGGRTPKEARQAWHTGHAA